jgi:predicted dithiol-disulfide oxidoreductase (DUF899 family)
MKTKDRKAIPSIVSPAEWEAAHEQLLRKEKAATRGRDALAAERRRMPMVEIEKSYVFEGPNGRAAEEGRLAPVSTVRMVAAP